MPLPTAYWPPPARARGIRTKWVPDAVDLPAVLVTGLWPLPSGHAGLDDLLSVVDTADLSVSCL